MLFCPAFVYSLDFRWNLRRIQGSDAFRAQYRVQLNVDSFSKKVRGGPSRSGVLMYFGGWGPALERSWSSKRHAAEGLEFQWFWGSDPGSQVRREVTAFGGFGWPQRSNKQVPDMLICRTAGLLTAWFLYVRSLVAPGEQGPADTHIYIYIYIYIYYICRSLPRNTRVFPIRHAYHISSRGGMHYSSVYIPRCPPLLASPNAATSSWSFLTSPLMFLEYRRLQCHYNWRPQLKRCSALSFVYSSTLIILLYIVLIQASLGHEGRACALHRHS